MEPVLRRKWRVRQEAVCERFDASLTMPRLELNAGVSRSVVRGQYFRLAIWPLNGARYLPSPTTTGWMIWAGENTMEDDFFVPVHTHHLQKWAPHAMPYLALPSGWSFVVAPGHEDVWFDESLLVD